MSEMYPLSFLNSSGEEIPPYAVMQIKADNDADAATTNFGSRLVAMKYDEYVAQEVHDDSISHVPEHCGRILALNSAVPVSDGAYGKCSFAFDQPAWARITDMSGNDAVSLTGFPHELVGMEFGPAADRWDINAGGWGFLFRSAPDTDLNRVLVQQISPYTPFKVEVQERTNPTTDPANTPLIAIPYRRHGAMLVKCQISDGVYTNINIKRSPTGFIDWGNIDAVVQWRGSTYNEQNVPTVFDTMSGGILRADLVRYESVGRAIGVIGEHDYKPEAVTKCGIVLADGMYVYATYDPEAGWLIDDFCCPSD